EKSVWASGVAYEPYVGRWSRLVAREFVDWLAIPPAARWLDVGCGTGALAETILRRANPAQVHGIDPSEGYLALAREQVRDPRVRFDVGDARRLPVETVTCDAVVSALVLNFIPDLAAGMAEMTRAVRPGGTVAGYVWDYAGKMELMRYFWDAVIALRPADLERDEGRRFPICHPGPLQQLFERSGLRKVEVRSIDVPTHFRNFEDYWTPFLGGQFPAPDYAMSLDEAARAALRERIRTHLPIAADGSIPLIARAWAVRGTRQTP
ncbi:MAG TPA: class I SAM-dependent methyltransferase, partial [Burkholderiales bacterium]|nr:class I SAM-dependent methyltransferase [Burkholderiales bacterium]